MPDTGIMHLFVIAGRPWWLSHFSFRIPWNHPCPADRTSITRLACWWCQGIQGFIEGWTTVRNLPWMRWFNSFGFITIMVFSFALLTTLIIPASEGNGNLARVHTLVQADGSQSPGRFM